MDQSWAKFCTLVVTVFIISQVAEGAKDKVNAMQKVGPGKYLAFTYERSAPGKQLAGVAKKIDKFFMDTYPVTNQQFLDFILANPEWSRKRVPTIFADSNYLSAWESDLASGNSTFLQSPVANVSWFAARAYCKSHNKRLPSLDEWEFAARPEAYGDKRLAILQKILNWYGKPLESKVQSITPQDMDCTLNRICGLHGHLWEWVEDFGSVMITDDNRNSTDFDNNLFCGASALGGMDSSNYAAYMRFAFRSSLKGTFTLNQLGFRCVK